MRDVRQALVVGVGMHGGHDAMPDGEGFVQHLRERCQAVRRTGGVGDQPVLPLEFLIVDPDHHVIDGVVGRHGQQHALCPDGEVFSSSCCAVDQVLAEGGRWPPILPPGLIIATPQEIDGRVSLIAGAPLQLQVPVNAIFDADTVTLTFAHADLIGHIEVLGDVLPDADAGGAELD